MRRELGKTRVGQDDKFRKIVYCTDCKATEENQAKDEREDYIAGQQSIT